MSKILSSLLVSFIAVSFHSCVDPIKLAIIDSLFCCLTAAMILLSLHAGRFTVKDEHKIIIIINIFYFLPYFCKCIRLTALMLDLDARKFIG